MSVQVHSMCRTASILSLLVTFNVGRVYGVDVVVKIDKYAPMRGDCDEAINNVEVNFLAPNHAQGFRSKGA